MLTTTERMILRQLDQSGDDKSLPYSKLCQDLTQMGGVTTRGFSIVLHRLESRDLVARNYRKVELTFGGVRALRG